MSTTKAHDALRSLKLDGMADVFVELLANEANRKADPVGWIQLMAEREHAAREARKLQSRLRAAKLRDEDASLSTVDFGATRDLDKAQFEMLATGGWITENSSVLITGPCGVGKSYLACALGYEACRQDKMVLYFRMPLLFSDLITARKDGTYDKLFKRIVKANVLILDDWGPDLMTPTQRRDLMEIVDARYQRKATVITSQLPVENWYEMIGDPTLADAILDRLVHKSHRVALKGASMRKVTATGAAKSPKSVPLASPV